MAQNGIAASAPQFGIGPVISTSLSIFSRNLVAFFVLAVIIGIPYVVMSVGFATGLDPNVIEQTGEVPPGFWGMLVVGSLIYLLTYVMTQSVIIYGTFQDLRGQRASFGDCLARGLAVLPRTLIAAIVASIGVMLASLLFIIPGIIVTLMWWVFVPVLVIEQTSIGESFGRSRDLTRGHRWGILGLMLIVGFAQSLVGMVVGLLAGVVGSIGGEILNALVTFFFLAFSAVLVAVGYYYLRAEKEGIVIDDIASVFD